MERVGLQGIAGKFPGDVGKSASVRDINPKSKQQNDDGGDTRFDMYSAKEETAEGFVNNVQGREEQEASFDERRKILEFSVAVGMLFVGRLIRNADGQKCDDG